PPPDGPGGNPAPVRPSPAVSAIPRAYKSSFRSPSPEEPALSAAKGRLAQGVRTPLPPRRLAIIGPRTRALVRTLRNAPVSFEIDALRRRTRAPTRNIVAVR